MSDQFNADTQALKESARVVSKESDIVQVTIYRIPERLAVNISEAIRSAAVAPRCAQSK